MMLWDVHVTVREPDGRRRNELCGIAAAEELVLVLPAAVERAWHEGGGVEVSPHRSPRGGVGGEALARSA